MNHPLPVDVMRTVTRVTTGLGLLVLVTLASVTALVPEGVCMERRADGDGNDETPRDGAQESGGGGSSTAVDPFRTYDAHRELIASENEMINHRMTWFLTVEGLLLASFFLVWRGKKETGRYEGVHKTEICILYSLGVFSAVSVGLVLFIGLNMIKCMVDGTPAAGRPYVIGLGHGPVPAPVHYLLPWNSLPVLFVAAWHLLVETQLAASPSPNPEGDGGTDGQGEADEENGEEK